MTKTRMKSKGSKQEWTGVSRLRPMNSTELKDFYQRNFADVIREQKDKREKYQGLRTFLITK